MNYDDHKPLRGWDQDHYFVSTTYSLTTTIYNTVAASLVENAPLSPQVSPPFNFSTRENL